MRSLFDMDNNARALFFACFGILTSAIATIVILSDACGSGRKHHQLKYMSEDILTCKHSDDSFLKTVPWIFVIGFALILPTIWYTWVRITTHTESIQVHGSIKESNKNENDESNWNTRHAIARATFASLLLACLVGLITGVHSELEGGWPNGKESTVTHRVGVVVWAGSFFMVHALTLIAYSRLNLYGSACYKIFEIMYGVLLVVFAVLFMLDEQSAQYLQILLLISVFIVSIGNIILGYKLIYPNGTEFCSLAPGASPAPNISPGPTHHV